MPANHCLAQPNASPRHCCAASRSSPPPCAHRGRRGGQDTFLPATFWECSRWLFSSPQVLQVSSLEVPTPGVSSQVLPLLLRSRLLQKLVSAGGIRCNAGPGKNARQGNAGARAAPGDSWCPLGAWVRRAFPMELGGYKQRCCSRGDPRQFRRTLAHLGVLGKGHWPNLSPQEQRPLSCLVPMPRSGGPIPGTASGCPLWPPRAILSLSLSSAPPQPPIAQ